MFLFNFELDNSFGKVRNIRVYETKVETFWKIDIKILEDFKMIIIFIITDNQKYQML